LSRPCHGLVTASHGLVTACHGLVMALPRPCHGLSRPCIGRHPPKEYVNKLWSLGATSKTLQHKVGKLEGALGPLPWPSPRSLEPSFILRSTLHKNPKKLEGAQGPLPLDKAPLSPKRTAVSFTYSFTIPSHPRSLELPFNPRNTLQKNPNNLTGAKGSLPWPSPRKGILDFSQFSRPSLEIFSSCKDS
jgi:hypothetical protein